MILKQTITKVEESKDFKSFIKNNPDYYLAHCFTMHSAKDDHFAWELGYYSKKKDKIVVFETMPEIKIRPEESAFKKSGTVKPLDLKKVKIGVKKALETCDEVVNEKYKAQNITKYIIILQNIEQEVYNITMVSMSFSIINVHINASTGKVLKDNIQSIMNLAKK